MKKSIVLGCVITLFPVVFSADSAAYAADIHKRNIVESEQFENFIKPNLPIKLQADLEQNGIDIKKLMECGIPSKCSIDFADFPKDYRMEKCENGFLIGTNQTLTLYGPYVAPSSRSYMIEAKISAPQENDFEESSVEMLLNNIGMYRPGNRTLLTEKIKPGETKKLSVSIDLEDDFGIFRPVFIISGKVVFENIIIYETESKDDKCSIVEGTITACSEIPDPQKSDYPDCRFTCHFEGNSILHGQPCPREMSLVLECFAKKRLLETKKLKAGDRVICLILPFNSLPPERQTTQQSLLIGKLLRCRDL